MPGDVGVPVQGRVKFGLVQAELAASSRHHGHAMAATTRTPQRREACTPDRREERRQAIIEAAARLFAELGYTACEMERVAAELGIAKGTLYLYFSSKEALFYACVDAGMRQMQSGRAHRRPTRPATRSTASPAAFAPTCNSSKITRNTSSC